MLSKNVSLLTLGVSVILTAFISFSIFTYICKYKNPIAVSNESVQHEDDFNYNLARLDGYEFIKPLLYAEPNFQSNTLVFIKPKIEQIITSNINEGSITSASVYLREFTKGNWISIGDSKKYYPGSLLKVPELIAIMRMNEISPGFLYKKIQYNKTFITDRNPIYLSNCIKLGNTYTVKELLKYMIVYSDNQATLLLGELINPNVFNKVFTDLGLGKPDLSKGQYPISAKDYSQFMKVLYNASYLSIEDSEYCTKLLSTSDFTKGILAGIPVGCKVIHKFGEGGFTDNQNLSESAIIFLNNSAYLLTVMADGKDLKKIPSVISEISRVVYQDMCNVNFANL